MKIAMIKRINLLAAAVAAFGLLLSCQRQDLYIIENTTKILAPVTLTASLDVIGTKVSYTEEDTGDNLLLHPTWEENDEVIGFDEENNTYTLVVTDVDEDGVATISGEAPANCSLHLIYFYDGDAADITGGSMSVNYEDQKGDKTMPAVMVADGIVVHSTGNFEFHNAGAVIGINKVHGVPKNTVISKISIFGENLSNATVALESDVLILSADTKATDSISTDEEFSVTVSDAEGTLGSCPVLIAVPAGAKVKEVYLKTDGDDYSYCPSSPAELAANEYSYVYGQKFKKVDYVIIGDLKWKKDNLAITESGKREFNYTGHVNGDYFQWAAHENYALPVADIGDGETDRGLLLYTSFTSKYCGDDTNEFELKDGKNFLLASAPYGGSAYTKYTLSTTTVLEKTDDVANIVLGGRWRMPTSAEFVELFSATYWKWDSTDSGYYVYAPDPDTEDAGKVNNGTGMYEKSDALLFFPAVGYGYKNQYNSYAGNNSCYFSVNLGNADTDRALDLYLTPTSVQAGEQNLYRMYGCSIRPVCDL